MALFKLSILYKQYKIWGLIRVKGKNMKEDKGVTQLKCDIIEAGIEAFALGFFCVLGINPLVSLILWLIFLQ